MLATLDPLTDTILPPTSVPEAAWRTVAYADIFDYPLTATEVHQFLQIRATAQQVESALSYLLEVGWLETDGSVVFLPDRGQVALLRKHRSQVAANMWPRARMYARMLWMLPFVRMVAITGSLAVGNAEPDHDIDVLLVTAPDRLWTVRGLAVLLGRIARLHRDRLCPNYLVTDQALKLERQDLYAAHEFSRMVPLHGRATARRMWAANSWHIDQLPQRPERDLEQVRDELPWILGMCKRMGEAILSGSAGARLERWERRRKIHKLSHPTGFPVDEATFNAAVCKGHYHGHGGRVSRLFRDRIQQWYDDSDRVALSG